MVLTHVFKLMVVPTYKWCQVSLAHKLRIKTIDHMTPKNLKLKDQDNIASTLQLPNDLEP